jgi:hypothetical protein
MTLKHLFGLLAIGWAALWIFSYWAIAGVMGSSVEVILVYADLALLPPSVLFVLFFRLVPQITKKWTKTRTPL